MNEGMGKSSNNILPVWLIALTILSSLFYVYIEVGMTIARAWDQETFLYYSYNNAFYEMWSSFEGYPQWNPYIQSGVSFNSNTPFQFSLSRFFTLLTQNGVVGYFLARGLLLVIAAVCLLKTLKELDLRPVLMVPVLFFFLEGNFINNGHERLPVDAAIVMLYANISFIKERRFYVIGLAGIYLGMVLNFWIAHAILPFFVFQICLLFFLRKKIVFISNLFFTLSVWCIGFILAFPTLIPLLFDAGVSQKVLQYSTTVRDDSFLKDFFFIFSQSFGQGHSWIWVIPMTIAFGTLLFAWSELKLIEKSIVNASLVFFVMVFSFYFFKDFLVTLPLVGKTIAAINPVRPTSLNNFFVILLFGISLANFTTMKLSLNGFLWKAGLTVCMFTIFWISKLDFKSFSEIPTLFITKSLLFSFFCVVLLLITSRVRFGNFRFMTLSVVLTLCVLATIRSGTRYTWRKPPQLNIFKQIERSAISLFPSEESGRESEMIEFLQRETKNNHIQTAELRDYPHGHDIFQRYPFLRISTINGFSDLRSLRTHMLYVWMVDDLREKSPKKYNMLYKWGGFTYDYGTRYNQNLLDLMGVNYLIAKSGDYDERFPQLIGGKKDQILVNENAFGRAFLVGKTRIIQSVNEMGQYLRSNNSDKFREEVPILKSDLDKIENSSLKERLLSGFNLGDTSKVTSVNNGANSKILEFSPNKVVVTVESNKPSILVLTQSFHRGWTVTVNKKPATLLPAYYSFLSVPVTEGKSTIVFTFNDKIFIYNAYLVFALLALLTVATGIAWFNTETKQRTELKKII